MHEQYGLATVGFALQTIAFAKMSRRQIFNTITNGKNTMMPYGPNIVSRIAAIIAYLRALQRSHTRRLPIFPRSSRGNGQTGVTRQLQRLLRNDERFPLSTMPEGEYSTAADLQGFSTLLVDCRCQPVLCLVGAS